MNRVWLPEVQNALQRGFVPTFTSSRRHTMLVPVSHNGVRQPCFEAETPMYPHQFCTLHSRIHDLHCRPSKSRTGRSPESRS